MFIGSIGSIGSTIGTVCLDDIDDLTGGAEVLWTGFDMISDLTGAAGRGGGALTTLTISQGARRCR